MATLLYDTEEQRFVDRIRCITYREIRDEMIAITGDSFITRQWISEKLHRRDRYNCDVLKTNVENTLKDLEYDTDLFIDFLCSMRKRFDALEAARGGHTKF